MTERTLKDKTAIVGIATTDLARDSGRTEYSLACEAVKLAVEDAGLEMADVDGIVKDISDGIDPMYLQKAVGIDNAQYCSDSHWGTSAIMTGVTAIAAGICNAVVYYRCLNGGSGRRAGNDFRAAREMKDEGLDLIRYDFYSPFGLLTPDGLAAMTVRRYLHEHGIEAEEVGWIPAVASEYAARNPDAIFFDEPIGLDDYADSTMRVDPLRELDCAPGVDGGLAVVLTSAERAKGLRHTPAVVMGVAQGTSTEGELLSNFTRPDISALPEIRLMGDELFRVAGIDRSDVDVAQLDDRYAPYVAMQLEELGFCESGSGVAFCEKGERLRVDGELPVNTGGGFLGGGFTYGLNVIEGVRQIRGTSASQVDGAEISLVVSGAGGPADGMILRRA
ncbi:MAG: lipid-transfer protein [Actinobacteria bacterium ATB1]|nr:lipid-transfer protein [Actinobacteria bacterium ATB1]